MPDPRTRDESSEPGEPGEPGALSRLLDAMRPRWSRPQLVVALLLAVLGFLTVVQVQDQNEADAFEGARRDDLIQLLDSLDTAAQRARQEIADLAERRDELRTSSDRQAAAIDEAREQVDELAMLAGTVPATGPGIIATITDPERTIGTTTLLNAMQELRDAGAEAIEINDSVRVVAQTSFVDAAVGVQIDGTPIQPPYRIEAIGDPHTLSEAVSFPGGLQDEVEELQGSAQVERVAAVEITSLHAHETPDYARPAG